MGPCVISSEDVMKLFAAPAMLAVLACFGSGFAALAQ
jgi:hypothetical protein